MTRRQRLSPAQAWWLFQAFSVVLAAGLLFATWEPGTRFFSQSLSVPAVIALTPLFVRSSFFRARAEARPFQLRDLLMIVGAAAAMQAFNIGLALAGEMPWRFAWYVSIPALAVQLIAIALFARRSRAAAS